MEPHRTRKRKVTLVAVDIEEIGLGLSFRRRGHHKAHHHLLQTTLNKSRVQNSAKAGRVVSACCKPYCRGRNWSCVSTIRSHINVSLSISVSLSLLSLTLSLSMPSANPCIILSSSWLVSVARLGRVCFLAAREQRRRTVWYRRGGSKHRDNAGS